VSKYSISVEKPLQITPFYAKQTQFFPIFHPKTTIPQKNKPNSNPIQSQTKPIMNQKLGGQSQTNPIQSQSLLCINNTICYTVKETFMKYLIHYWQNKLKVLRVPNKINRSTENEHFRFWQGRRSRQCTALSMEPDDVQKRNKPFGCRVILLGALRKVVEKC
jgi:hypothetical protein